MANPESNLNAGGGMATLTVALAHLETIQQVIGEVDGKAMFYTGLNFVGLGIFVGALTPLGWSFWAAAAPGALTLIVALLGGWALWPRDVAQFPAPLTMAQFEGAGYNDDELAWAYVGSIAVAVEEASRINALKVRATYVMFILTVLHIAAVVASAAVFGA